MEVSHAPSARGDSSRQGQGPGPHPWNIDRADSLGDSLATSRTYFKPISSTGETGTLARTFETGDYGSPRPDEEDDLESPMPRPRKKKPFTLRRCNEECRRRAAEMPCLFW